MSQGDPGTGLHTPVQTSVERKKNNGIVGAGSPLPFRRMAGI